MPRIFQPPPFPPPLSLFSSKVDSFLLIEIKIGTPILHILHTRTLQNALLKQLCEEGGFENSISNLTREPKYLAQAPKQLFRGLIETRGTYFREQIFPEFQIHAGPVFWRACSFLVVQTWEEGPLYWNVRSAVIFMPEYRSSSQNFCKYDVKLVATVAKPN